jgi:hypothetical protein
LRTALSRQQLQDALSPKDSEHFSKAHRLPAIASGLVEMTLPAKLRSSKQRYRLTDAVRACCRPTIIPAKVWHAPASLRSDAPATRTF